MLLTREGFAAVRDLADATAEIARGGRETIARLHWWETGERPPLPLGTALAIDVPDPVDNAAAQVKTLRTRIERLAQTLEWAQEERDRAAPDDEEGR